MFQNWNQRVFKGFSNDHDHNNSEHMPDKFKIDAFLLLIDVSIDRSEKQPIEDQLELAKNILRNMKDIKKVPVVIGELIFRRTFLAGVKFARIT